MLAYVFVVFAVAVRFMPHPLAFTPIAAALLYFGARGPRRQLWVPLALLAATDVILTKIAYSYPLTWDHFVTWAWYAAILLLGTRLRENANWLRVGGAALASSVSFFVVSNFAVWACWASAAESLATCCSPQSCSAYPQSPPWSPAPTSRTEPQPLRFLLKFRSDQFVENLFEARRRLR